jgi:hypothetical protein
MVVRKYPVGQLSRDICPAGTLGGRHKTNRPTCPGQPINAEFVMVAARLFQQAMDAGYGREEVSALFKVLQK